MKILMVLTSHEQLGDSGHKTGFWAEEFAAPYYAFKDAGAEVVLASPNGGQPPIDPNSQQAAAQTNETVRLFEDEAALEQLANTLQLSQVTADGFDAIFYPGGHGPLWDLSEDPLSIGLIQQFWEQDKPVAAVCHAPAVLVHAKTPAGKPLVAGRKVSAFTNSEEAAVGLTDVVPFLLEDKLQELGAHYQKVDDWKPLAVVDGNLITGQNPASSAAVARALLQQLKH
ncbi:MULTISPECIES: type 1 glutamine amidotransferase domain-containing protein [Gammaproteobacteria]|uniref:Intracellular protease/amidase n=7 Tax=Gammaproteobacteria TaxID=1236 RepID=A0A368UKL1_9GAMM|nr:MULTISPECIES: type 1 glutamine amidotransferase domain-containing protein [Gammaproteobacteria]MDT7525416.1 type 1 glutamine amidotransferase domain-containing protein [Pseudidiomarina sp. GXY010]MDX1526845.1 type 1 glutamine amidotransferase domain-containing protein [Pseudidiomarina maritima]MRJ43011.1 type 1 glutamine amidotransferase domain-containing protein [Idiomarina sp. FeN1]NCU58564.1 type 1 glutamine amidotransferase domain-containing protein [Idiomarina sp. FenA--70]NCU61261.1 t